MKNLKKIFIIVALIVIFITVFTFYNQENKENDYVKEDYLLFNECISSVHNAFDYFWENYEEGTHKLSQIVELNNLYEKDKENCYLNYHPYFLIYSHSMTNKEVIDEIEKQEKYIRSENIRLFESSPVDVQLNYYKRVYNNLK